MGGSDKAVVSLLRGRPGPFRGGFIGFCSGVTSLTSSSSSSQTSSSSSSSSFSSSSNAPSSSSSSLLSSSSSELELRSPYSSDLTYFPLMPLGLPSSSSSSPTPTPSAFNASSYCSSKISKTLRKKETHSARPRRPDRPPPMVCRCMSMALTMNLRRCSKVFSTLVGLTRSLVSSSTSSSSSSSGRPFVASSFAPSFVACLAMELSCRPFAALASEPLHILMAAGTDA